MTNSESPQSTRGILLAVALISAATLAAQLKQHIEQQPDARVDYVEFFNPESLRAVTNVSRRAHLALAVFVGTTRLIDNARL